MVTAAPLSELTATVLLPHTEASQTAVTTPMTSGCAVPSVALQPQTSVRRYTCHLPGKSMHTIPGLLQSGFDARGFQMVSLYTQERVELGGLHALTS